jgi:hypothetical protein
MRTRHFPVAKNFLNHNCHTQGIFIAASPSRTLGQTMEEYADILKEQPLVIVVTEQATEEGSLEVLARASLHLAGIVGFASNINTLNYSTGIATPFDQIMNTPGAEVAALLWSDEGTYNPARPNPLEDMLMHYGTVQIIGRTCIIQKLSYDQPITH